MKFLKYILLFLLIVIIGTAIYIATLPSSYDIKTSKIIKAPAALIFENINDYKNWQYWGPWYETDPTIVASYPEITSGFGASYSWTGKEGVGSIKTISLVENKGLIQQIDFGTGSTPEVYWDITETDTGNKVTWGMRGESSFTEKAFWLTQGGIEKNLKPMYTRGLELLEQHILKVMDTHSFNIIGEIDHGGGFYLYQSTSCKTEDANTKMGEMFPAVINYMKANSIEPSGKPFLLTHNRDTVNNTTMFSTCVPVKERVITTGNVLTGFLKPQKTFKTIFYGSYQYSYKAWEAAYKELAEKGYTAQENSEPFEVYSVRPTDTPNPAKWVTEIYIPIN
jgi:effector-binding domain-containing protein